MNLRDKAALLAFKGSFAQDIDIRDIEDSLLSNGLINFNEKQQIHALTTSHQQSLALVDLLVKKNHIKTFDKLIESLRAPYAHIADQLLEVKSSPQTFRRPSSDLESIFIEGGVPIGPAANIELRYSSELKQHLIDISRRPDGGWILVHGLGGAGKSVLAAQAIRGRDEEGNPIVGYFFNQVFWFTIGQLRRDDWESLLLKKMQIFCARLDPSSRSSPPLNLESAKDLLRSIMFRKYPCGLLVLDDVWDPRILRYFNVEARVMVTSRLVKVMSRIQRGAKDRCKVLMVKEGFSEDQSRELICHMVDSEYSAAEIELINQLHQKCRGNPFIISIFGGLLSIQPKRLNGYLKRFERNLLNAMQVDTGDYEYSSIMEAILVSVEELAPETECKDHYLRLSIFPQDSFLSAKFLSQYCWRDVDEEDAAEIMDKFVSLSLASSENYKPEHSLYTLHDIIVLVLSVKYKVERKQFNEDFVRRVLEVKRSKRSWLDMEDDWNYLAYNFIYHLIGATSVPPSEKMQILADFDFITWLCCQVGPDNLAFQYHYACKSPGLEESLRDFEEFIRSPAFRIQSCCLATRRSDSALIQLALTLPEHNQVQRMATEAAVKHQNCYCFYSWANHLQTEEQIERTFKVKGNVVSLGMNSNNSHAVIASDSSAQILDAKTGATTYSCRKDAIAKQLEMHNQQLEESPVVVSAMINPSNDCLLVLTEGSLIRIKLPATALESVNYESPAPPTSGNDSSLHFPPGRLPGTNEFKIRDEQAEMPVYQIDDPSAIFTCMCFENSSKLLVGSSDGKVRELTVTDSLINCSFEFFLGSNAGENQRIQHITVAKVNSHVPLVAVSGPDVCVHLYRSRYDRFKYSGHQDSRCVPVQTAIGPGDEPSIAASIANNEVHLWCTSTQQRLAICKGPQRTTFECVAFCSSGVILAVGTSTRAHIYLYRISELTQLSAKLELIDELNGSGTYTKSLAFTKPPESFLYSVSELAGEGVLTCWRTSASYAPSPRQPVQRQSSVFFGTEKTTLRLRTVLDAVNVSPCDFVVACQSVRRSLLILRSKDFALVHVAKHTGDRPLRKAITISLAPDGKYAAFAFDDEVVIAEDDGGDEWSFETIPESVRISAIVMLPDGHGFVASDCSGWLLVFRGRQRVSAVERPHSQLRAAPQMAPKLGGVLAMGDRGWSLYACSADLPLLQEASLGDTTGEPLLCIDSCRMQRGCYVAGGCADGTLSVWRFGESEPAGWPSRSLLTRQEDASCCIRCVRFSPVTGTSRCLLAGAFDDHKFSVWALMDDSDCQLAPLIACQPVQLGAQLQPSEIGCLQWCAHTGRDNSLHYKLLIASDCVHVCCLSDAEVAAQLALAGSCRPGIVSLYSKQSVVNVLVLSDGADVLFVDNSHTVFWMRVLSHDPSVPVIPCEFAVEQQ